MKIKSLLGLMLFLMLSLGLTSCLWYVKRGVEKDGALVIAKIESFKKDKGRLPESITEVDKEMNPNGPFLYIKESPTKYTLSADLSMDSSDSYNSETKEWKVRP